jgi:hypothetical protein
MDDQKELHARRLHEGLTQLAAIREMEQPTFTPDFDLWKQRVLQSLRELFTDKNDYVRNFKNLPFWHSRLIVNLRGGSGGPQWTSGDQRKFDESALIAEQIIKDALEELQVYSTPRPATGQNMGPVKQMTPIIVNVTAVLSQSIEVHVSQLLQGLKDLHMPDGDRALAETEAKALHDETRGQQRWPVLAKSLETLKSLGKPVYERVAIPLLLEMLKKQTGL